MASSSDEDAAAARARRLGRRIGIVVVLCIAVAFIWSSTAQITLAVFGYGVRPLPEAPPGSDARACADGIRALSQTLGAAGDPASGHETDRERTAYRACAASPEGLDAWAALLRLRRTAEQTPRAAPRALEALRRDLFAHLPADLR
jgi:hypothetical protein